MLSDSVCNVFLKKCALKSSGKVKKIKAQHFEFISLGEVSGVLTTIGFSNEEDRMSRDLQLAILKCSFLVKTHSG